MVSRNLVICDQEERYAAALAHFFMKTKELALGVQVCNSVGVGRTGEFLSWHGEERKGSDHRNIFPCSSKQEDRICIETGKRSGQNI